MTYPEFYFHSIKALPYNIQNNSHTVHTEADPEEEQGGVGWGWVGGYMNYLHPFQNSLIYEEKLSS